MHTLAIFEGPYSLVKLFAILLICHYCFLLIFFTWKENFMNPSKMKLKKKRRGKRWLTWELRRSPWNRKLYIYIFFMQGILRVNLDIFLDIVLIKRKYFTVWSFWFLWRIHSAKWSSNTYIRMFWATKIHQVSDRPRKESPAISFKKRNNGITNWWAGQFRRVDINWNMQLFLISQ